ncbi:hypothetical protein, partial [Vibrio diabolicus]|uniref:hypothetical protein n=1 Tax=Vibrio diabolicus TaxID=50719 RepID=UPI00215F4AE8
FVSFAIEAEAYSKELTFSVKHFFKLIFRSFLSPYCQLLLRFRFALTTEAHYREMIFLGNPFLEKKLKKKHRVIKSHSNA